jgi:hypothetical protein
VRVADSAHAVLVQSGVVTPVELFEGRLVAALVAQHESAITIEVDGPRILNFLRPQSHGS